MSHQHTPVSASVIKSTSRLAPKAVPRKKQQPNVPPPRVTPAPTLEENDTDQQQQPEEVDSQIDPSLQVTQPVTRTSQRRLHPTDESSALTYVGLPSTETSIPSGSKSQLTQRAASASAPTRTLRSSGPVPQTNQSVESSLPTSVAATTTTSTTTTTTASRKRRSAAKTGDAESSPRRSRRKSTPPSAEQVEISPATMTMSEMCVDKRTGRKSSRYAELQEAERQRKRIRLLKREQEANGVQNTPAPDPVPTTSTEMVVRSAEEDDALLPVTSGTAQVMTDSEGNIVLDRTSLRVDLHAVHPTTLTDSLTHTTETVFSSKTNSSTYPSMRKYASNTIRWLPADNERFYTALQMFGTDFGMVADYLGGGKTRRHVKNKFDREEKRDPEKLTWALRNRIEPDIAGLEETRGRRMRRMDDIELKETLAGIREEARVIMALPSLSQNWAWTETKLATAMRPTANPVPKTEAAREALRSFYCDLCDRGYSGINEYEAHLSSYTHTHKKNLKEMKASQKNTSLSAAEDRHERERLREEKEMQRLMGAKGAAPTVVTAATSIGSKSINLTPKPGFKKVESTTTTATVSGGGGGWKTAGVPTKRSVAELSWGNEGEDDYDPAYPTPA